MENQKKKLRLEDIKVESFVTQSKANPDTIRGGTVYNNCDWTTGCTKGKWCADNTFAPDEVCQSCTPDSTNIIQ